MKDFEGQKLAEFLSTILLSIVGVRYNDDPRLSRGQVGLHCVVQAIAFVVGYFCQDIKLAVFIALGGTALTFLVVVPPWPFFNKNPAKWLPVRGGATYAVPQNLVIDEKAIR